MSHVMKRLAMYSFVVVFLSFLSSFPKRNMRLIYLYTQTLSLAKIHPVFQNKEILPLIIVFKKLPVCKEKYIFKNKEREIQRTKTFFASPPISALWARGEVESEFDQFHTFQYLSNVLKTYCYKEVK